MNYREKGKMKVIGGHAPFASGRGKREGKGKSRVHIPYS